mmetsp:Transcript_83330/g.222830  ORF Transcript_83330/g.222830 Transcript_83330/m.222830 type:complete len:313 (-) Transcript_83330:2252-3190(-)
MGHTAHQHGGQRPAMPQRISQAAHTKVHSLDTLSQLRDCTRAQLGQLGTRPVSHGGPGNGVDAIGAEHGLQRRDAEAAPRHSRQAGLLDDGIGIVRRHRLDHSWDTIPVADGIEELVIGRDHRQYFHRFLHQWLVVPEPGHGLDRDLDSIVVSHRLAVLARRAQQRHRSQAVLQQVRHLREKFHGLYHKPQQAHRERGLHKQRMQGGGGVFNGQPHASPGMRLCKSCPLLNIFAADIGGLLMQAGQRPAGLQLQALGLGMELHCVHDIIHQPQVTQILHVASVHTEVGRAADALRHELLLVHVHLQVHDHCG